jgi:hypothetical protein
MEGCQHARKPPPFMRHHTRKPARIGAGPGFAAGDIRHRTIQPHVPIPPQPDIPQSARAASSTASAWPGIFTFGQIRARRPSGPIRKVARVMPI